MAKRWYAFKLDKNLAGKYYIPAGSYNVISIDGRFSYFNSASIASEAFRSVTKPANWFGFILAKLESPAHKATTCNVVGNLDLKLEDALKIINEGSYK